jgi:DNA polymerase
LTPSLKINPSQSRACLTCGLFLNQLPIKENKASADVFWVGLSAVKLDKEDPSIPLSKATKTGSLIHDIEKECQEDLVFYKTNAVKCLPLKSSKIRYPSRLEMQECYPNLELELEVLSPRIVFLLGKQVSDFILSQHGIKIPGLNTEFSYEPISIGETLYVPIHHPSYILVYKRKKVSEYISAISKLINRSFAQKRVA